MFIPNHISIPVWWRKSAQLLEFWGDSLNYWNRRSAFLLQVVHLYSHSLKVNEHLFKAHINVNFIYLLYSAMAKCESKLKSCSGLPYCKFHKFYLIVPVIYIWIIIKMVEWMVIYFKDFYNSGNPCDFKAILNFCLKGKERKET